VHERGHLEIFDCCQGRVEGEIIGEERGIPKGEIKKAFATAEVND
jgi:hypothetical protein